MKKQSNQFLKVDHKLLLCEKLTITEVLLISDILSFQNDDKEYFRKRLPMAKICKCSPKTLERTITELNKKSFMHHKLSFSKSDGTFKSRSTKFIDKNLLNKFLEEKEIIPTIKKANSTSKNLNVFPTENAILPSENNKQPTDIEADLKTEEREIEIPTPSKPTYVSMSAFLKQKGIKEITNNKARD